MEHQGSIKIGTCGFGDFNPPAGWKNYYTSKLAAFAETMDILEVNNTFYQLPKISTCERWQEEAGYNLEFAIKAWQGLTHPVNSPTWRKRKEKLTEKQLAELGNLRPNESVFHAWDETRKCAEALNAPICVIQTPSSFGCTKENRDNMAKFFSKIDRGSLSIAWEPRGNWNKNPEEIKAICKELNLIHIMDLMRREPLSDLTSAYIRLHGLNKNEYDYNYNYSIEELKELARKLAGLGKKYETIYCLFNNLYMHENASRLKQIIKQS